MDLLIFIYLILFPFGKLLGQTQDLLVLIISVFGFIKHRNYRINNFVLICIFSLIFSLSFFNLPQILNGLFYLIRLISYFYLSQIVNLQFGKVERKRKLIINSLITVGIFIAIFGWIQYLIFPDLRALKTLGWDDHYFRLVSTFLDPAFTGILLVLTEILVLIKTVKKKTGLNYLLNVFLLITVLFTYSRSSYLALFFAVLFLFYKFRKKVILIFLALFLIFIPLLPRPGGEGVNLARTYTVVDKFQNSKTAFKVIKKSPVFGIGFDNICIATLNNTNIHSCSGFDNSILFIIATTGVIGFVIFLQMIYKIIVNTKFDAFGFGLLASLIAIFIHGMFTETFFYNFVLGWMAILIGVTRKEVKG
ncbi:MAG TPA: O-antigen ligase family protein [Patescibacteria group bacterium]|nr:O-antigen ligase family protein [Patescibacteria group bacterium]